MGQTVANASDDDIGLCHTARDQESSKPGQLLHDKGNPVIEKGCTWMQGGAVRGGALQEAKDGCGLVKL